MTHFETEEVSKEYKKAFNAGYQMSEHEPELLDKILKSPNHENECFKAMISGKKQHELERTKARQSERSTRKSGQQSARSRV